MAGWTRCWRPPGSVAALVLAWLLFPVAIGLILGLFAEDVDRRGRAALLSGSARAAGMSLAAQVCAGAPLRSRSPCRSICSPCRSICVPGANCPVYLALNGYLLGREYFELVAARRLPLGELAQLRRRLRGRLWLAGVADRRCC